MAYTAYVLLVRLIQHKPKWTTRTLRWPAKDIIGSAFDQHTVDHILLNDLDFLESGFLKLFTRELDNLDAGDEDAPQICRLLDFLDDVANEALLPAELVPANSGTYPKLENLLAFLDTAPGSFNLAGNSARSLFLIRKPYQGSLARSLTSEVDQYLETLQQPTRRAFSTSMGHKRTLASKSTTMSIPNHNEHQQFLGHLLDSLEDGFDKCVSCRGGKHQVMIRIPAAHALEEEHSSWDVDTFVRCSGLQSWRGIKYRPETEHVLTPVLSKQLCEYLQYSLELNRNLMLYLGDSSKAYRMSADYLEPPSTDPNVHPMKSLQDLMDVDGVFHLPVHAPRTVKPWRSIERRQLAAKLAFSLTLMTSDKHLLQPWSSGKIQFVGLTDSGHDGSSPYLSCTIGEKQKSALTFIDELHPIEAYTEFAKLLLELEYGPIPKTESGVLTHSAVLGEYEKQVDYRSSKYLEAVDACLRFHMLYYRERLKPSQLGDPEYTRVKLIFEEIIQKIETDAPTGRRPPPRKASSDVRPLTRFNRPTNQQLYTQRLNTTDLLGKIHVGSRAEGQPGTGHTMAGSEVLSTIGSTDLRHSTASNLPRIQKSKQTPPRVPPKPKNVQWALPLGKQEPRSSTDASSAVDRTAKMPSLCKASKAATEAIGSRRIDTWNAKCITTANYITRRQRIHSPDPTKLFSVDIENPISASGRTGTKEWLDGFNDLRKRFKTGRARGPPLRIAILDSGIDMSHEEAVEADEDGKIGDYRVFVENSDKLDHCGHGTHIAGIVLQLTDNVQIFVAKITDEAEAEDKNAVRRSVAKALQHARTEWKVDMISLSFGYSQPGAPDDVGAEIEKCVDAKIVVFASASNDGGNRPRTYPGNYEHVVCVHSSTSDGNASSFNPSPETGKDNFTVVGEYIKSWWPPTGLCKPNNTSTDARYLSGTSFATPVAISIAAFMLGYIRKHLSEYSWNIEPRSPVGIRRIFRQMSRENSRDNYNFVSPQWFFDRYSEDRIVADLIDHRGGLGGYK